MVSLGSKPQRVGIWRHDPDRILEAGPGERRVDQAGAGNERIDKAVKRAKRGKEWTLDKERVFAAA